MRKFTSVFAIVELSKEFEGFNQLILKLIQIFLLAGIFDSVKFEYEWFVWAENDWYFFVLND